MSVLKLVALLLAVPLTAAGLAQPEPSAAGAPPPTRAESAPPAATVRERLGWNPRERTARGIDDLRAGRTENGRAALETALRLRPDEPATQFNAGTARLAQGDSSATTLLEQAAQGADQELAPAAWYNLGTARLAAGELEGAVAAFIETLERKPEHAAAKHNLELALRQLEQQKKEQEQQRKEHQEEKQEQQESPGDEGQQKPSDASDSESPSEPKPGTKPDASDESSSRREREAPGGDGSPEQAPAPESAARNVGQEPTALPQFRDLPDMTAEQAAAILRAVENLERQQRRDRAAKAAAVANTVEIDW